MNTIIETPTAVTAKNQFVEINGRTLAYRSIGEGKPIVLATRFRGNMDLWDPAFLDLLAANGLRVVTFDFSGLGLSTGDPTYNPIEMAKDIRDIIKGLDLKEVIIAGWSLGGLATQAALALYPENVSHVVLIGTGPAGPLVKEAEQLFYEIAGKPVNDFDDNVILFFEPKSEKSRNAARRSLERIALRKTELSKPVPVEFAQTNLGDGPKNPMFPADFVLDAMRSTNIPILHIGGDHDIIFPVENWYALNDQLPTLQLLTYPRAGHGPQHEYPGAAASYIATFAWTTD
jgi:pimeloyl-ACP methyl ester carboxylesterase